MKDDILKIMKNSWEEKAQENAYHWVDSSKEKWNRMEYYKKGIEEVLNYAISFW